MKTKMILLFLVLGSWGAFAQHEHAKKSDAKMDQGMAMFKDAKLGKAYEHYTHLKDALVASNHGEANKAAGALEKSLKDVSGSAKAAGVTAKIINASTIDDQRKSFSLLSNEMAALVKGGKLSGGMLYLEYCPMANNNAGAFWLSNEKEIKNPYFGDKMLKCGSVKEMIQ